MRRFSGRRTTTTLSSFTALITLGLLLGACGAGGAGDNAGGMNHSGGSNAGAMATTNTAAPFDQQFIDMMVPHHLGAVEMAKIAQSRAEHPELKTLANGIIASQNTEVGQMKGYRKAWYGSDTTPSIENMPMLPGMDHNIHMDMAKEIRDLRTATPFDKAFIMAMLPHHQSAIEAAKLAQQQATKPETKTLAGSIIADQQREIDQMNGWMKAWYGSSASTSDATVVGGPTAIVATGTAAAAATIIAVANRSASQAPATISPINPASLTATAGSVRAPTAPAGHAGHGG